MNMHKKCFSLKCLFDCDWLLLLLFSEHLCLSTLLSSSFDGHDEDLDITDESTSDGHTASVRTNGGDGNMKDIKVGSRQIPSWLSNSTPDEFIV
jgi:hypothetical protein